MRKILLYFTVSFFVVGCTKFLIAEPKHLYGGGILDEANLAVLSAGEEPGGLSDIGGNVDRIEKLTPNANWNPPPEEFWRRGSMRALPSVFLKPGRYRVFIGGAWGHNVSLNSISYNTADGVVEVDLKAGHKYAPARFVKDGEVVVTVLDLGTDFPEKCFMYYKNVLNARRVMRQSSPIELEEHLNTYKCKWNNLPNNSL